MSAKFRIESPDASSSRPRLGSVPDLDWELDDDGPEGNEPQTSGAAPPVVVEGGEAPLSRRPTVRPDGQGSPGVGRKVRKPTLRPGVDPPTVKRKPTLRPGLAARPRRKPTLRPEVGDRPPPGEPRAAAPKRKRLDSVTDVMGSDPGPSPPRAAPPPPPARPRQTKPSRPRATGETWPGPKRGAAVLPTPSTAPAPRPVPVPQPSQPQPSQPSADVAPTPIPVPEGPPAPAPDPFPYPTELAGEPLPSPAPRRLVPRGPWVAGAAGLAVGLIAVVGIAASEGAPLHATPILAPGIPGGLARAAAAVQPLTDDNQAPEPTDEDEEPAEATEPDRRRPRIARRPAPPALPPPRRGGQFLGALRTGAGRINASSNKPCLFWLDGYRQGTSRGASLSVDPGGHVVTCMLPSGQVQVRRVSVPAGGTVSIGFRFYP